jgi:hypothetical protein
MVKNEYVQGRAQTGRILNLTQTEQAPNVEKFREMFIIIIAKNIELEAKLLTFQECRGRIIAYLNKVLN